LTRERLLASARTVFAREGYGGASVDRIAEEAGFSKGAFYSNFKSKEDIFLELLEHAGTEDTASLREALENISAPDKMIEAVSQWAARHHKDVEMPMLLLEMLRRARANKTLGKRHEQLFHEHWKAVGTLIMPIFAGKTPPLSPLMLGALVMELIYGSALWFRNQPSTSDLITITLTSLKESAR